MRMCLALPLRVVRIFDEARCLVEGGGRPRHVFYDGIEDLQEGDWVLVEANLVLERLSDEEAQQALQDALHYVFGEDEGDDPED